MNRPSDRPWEPAQPGADPQDLVLLHGWGMNAGVWDGLPAALAAHLTQHRIELPGHGASPFAPPLDGDPGALWAWARACLAAAPPRAIWLGWSLGGLVALAAALSAPGRVSALILMTATPRFVQARDWTPAMSPETLTQFHDALMADPQGTLGRFLALQVRGDERARETLRTLRAALALRPAANPGALGLGLDLLRDEDLRGPLPDLKPPSLWLFGSHDALVPPRVAERIQRLLPEARTRIIAAAAHAPFLSHPAETTAAILDFLAEIAPSPASALAGPRT